MTLEIILNRMDRIIEYNEQIIESCNELKLIHTDKIMKALNESMIRDAERQIKFLKQLKS